LFQDYYNTKKALKTITYSVSNTELARHLPNPVKKVRQFDKGKQKRFCSMKETKPYRKKKKKKKKKTPKNK